VLRAHPVAGLGAEIRLQHRQHRTQDRQAGHAQVAAVALQAFDQILLEQRIKHDTGRFLDLGQHAVELLLGPHQGIDVLDRHHLGVLGGCGACHGGQSLTGGIRDEMQVEIAVGLCAMSTACWWLRESLWIYGRRPCRKARCKPVAGQSGILSTFRRSGWSIAGIHTHAGEM